MIRREDDNSSDNDDVASDAEREEERLQKSNWPMFDSISVDESIVEKRERNPSNKQKTLYIIREVLTIHLETQSKSGVSSRVHHLIRLCKSLD